MAIDPELAQSLRTPFPNDFDDIVTTRRLQQERLHAVGPVRDEAPYSVTWRDHEIESPRGKSTFTVRLYQNSSHRAPNGALLLFHGGAFVFGGIESEHQRCLRYCDQGECVVASVDYSLAPEFPFPAAFDEGVAALVWLTQNASSLGLDPARIGVGGVSAGGVIAAGVALHARDTGGPRIRSLLLVYPVTDNKADSPSMREFRQAEPFDGERAQKMWALYLGPNVKNVSPYASVARAESLSDLPPTYIVTADLDPLRDEGIDFARALIASGNTVELHHYPRTFHGFDAVAPTARISERALREQCEFLREELGPPPLR